MRTRVQRMVLAAMIAIPLLSVFGCASQGQKAEQRILEALETKYGEEFALDAIGGGYGTMNSGTLKAVVHPKRDSSMRFDVEITKDLERVYDNYLNVTLMKRTEGPIQELANQVWEDAKVQVANNDTGLIYPDEADLAMTYAEFVKLYPNNWQLVDVILDAERYIEDDGSMNEAQEIDRYSAFAALLADHGYVRSSVSVMYVSSSSYARMAEAERSDRSIVRLFEKEEEDAGTVHFLTRVGYRVDLDGEILEDRSEIASYFGLWADRREAGKER
ncbi:hypothetical protein MO973_10335 [Paenibacillus sp. TRM 82003]|nr:hypothetical protein [Paenibacillus sp. TRM 82003]